MRYPTWNPVLFQPKNGPLTLYFKVGPSPDTWWGEVITTAPMMARPGIIERNCPTMHRASQEQTGQLADGTILCPSSDEAGGPWTVHVELTKDGKTWTKVGPLNDGKKVRAIQPTVIMLAETSRNALSRWPG